MRPLNVGQTFNWMNAWMKIFNLRRTNTKQQLANKFDFKNIKEILGNAIAQFLI